MAPPNKTKNKPKSTSHWITKEELSALIDDFYSTERFSPELGVAVMKFSEKYCAQHNVKGYTFRDDLYCDIISRIVSCLNKRQIKTTGNPHSYMTQVAYTAFLVMLGKEQKYHQMKSNCIIEDVGMLDELSEDL